MKREHACLNTSSRRLCRLGGNIRDGRTILYDAKKEDSASFKETICSENGITGGNKAI
jgi:hypothetical protein